MSSLSVNSSISSCSKPVDSCIQLDNSSAICFGLSLPYRSTSFILSNDSNDYNSTQEKLLLWSGLKAIPKCWDVIQPLLCSIYLPRCENNHVYLPPRSLCQITREPCSIVDKHYDWLDLPQCSNNQVYQDTCDKPKDVLKFNKSSCVLPLISTSYKSSYFNEIEGCGLQCKDPFFDQLEHDDIYRFIKIVTIISCLLSVFALLSFVIDWKNCSKYPARIVFYINLCFFITHIGWSIQFLPGARELITCRTDGTVRLNEPSSNSGSALCVFVFIIIYFFLMAGLVWFGILSYVWYVMFRVVGKGENTLYGKVQKFHLIAWSLPLVMTVSCLSFSVVDGDPLIGICFVSKQYLGFRIIFLLIPLVLTIFFGGFYVIRGIISLNAVKNFHQRILSAKTISKVKCTMLKIGACSLSVYLFISFAFAVESYQYVKDSKWKVYHKEYVKCQMNSTIMKNQQTCTLQHKPSVLLKKLQIFCYFGSIIVVSSLVWTKASFRNWRRNLRRLTGRSDNEMKRIRQPSKLIAKAFAHRKSLANDQNKTDILNEVEDLMFSEHTISHQDPVAMNFVLDSVSINLPPKWYRHVPKLIRRRGAIHMQQINNQSDKRKAGQYHWAMRCSPVGYNLCEVKKSLPHSKINTVSEAIAEKKVQTEILDQKPSALRKRKIAASETQNFYEQSTSADYMPQMPQPKGSFTLLSFNLQMFFF